VSTLVLGLGNPTRTDDGIGQRVVEAIAAWNQPDVEVQAVQQLAPEWAEVLARHTRALIVDAAREGEPVALRPVDAARPADRPTSHACLPHEMVGLAQCLYGRCADTWLCTVRGECFDFGTELSPRAAARVEQALARIRAWLRSDQAPP
jgi:hydrogenase maturation protease